MHKRFAIIGLPGSGKSTFARKLGKLLNIPVHHLDKYQFIEGKKRDKQEFIALQKALVQEESWIIEGCSFSTFEMRFARADTVIYFLFPRLLCIARLVKRLFNYNPSFGGLRAIPWELIRYIWNFDREKRAHIEALKAKYPTLKFIIFRKQKEADTYIKKFIYPPSSGQ